MFAFNLVLLQHFAVYISQFSDYWQNMGAELCSIKANSGKSDRIAPTKQV
jgi:hypothetical protein